MMLLCISMVGQTTKEQDSTIYAAFKANERSANKMRVWNKQAHGDMIQAASIPKMAKPMIYKNKTRGLCGVCILSVCECIERGFVRYDKYSTDVIIIRAGSGYLDRIVRRRWNDRYYWKDGY
jgi:hypothetical protein